MDDTSMQDYLFDLNGYLILQKAVSLDLILALNERLEDVFAKTQGQEWYGHLHRIGSKIEQIYEAGPPFEELIDHPSWIKLLERYIGTEAGAFNSHLFIDQNWGSMRGPGKGLAFHSGGHDRSWRTQFRFHNNMFRCGQVNIILALSDIGPGDGATMVIPGSHKSNLRHPAFDNKDEKGQVASEYFKDQAIEVHLEKGDAVLFVDALAHGSTARTNPGERRAILYRYGPMWGRMRFGYEPSPQLLARLTPERRRIILPVEPRRPPNGDHRAI